MVQKRGVSQYYKNIVKVFTGNVVAQAASFAAIPLLTRLYSPEDIGVANTVVMAASLCVIVATLRMDVALFIGSSGRNVYHKLALGLCFLFFAFLLCQLFSILILLVHGSDFSSLLFFTSLIFLGMGSFNLLLGLYNFKKKYAEFAVSRVVMTWIAIALKLLFGWMCFGWSGFLTAVFFSYISVSLAVVFRLRDDVFKIVKSIKFGVRTWKENKNFIKFNVTTSFVNALGQFIPILFLGHFWGAEIVGLYTLAISILRAPVNLLGEAFRKVFIQEASEYIAKSNDSKLVRKFDFTTILLFGVSSVSLMAASIVLWEFSSDIFGSQWANLGLYIATLSPWFVFLMCNPPATSILTLKEKHKFMFLYELVFTLFRVLSLLIPILLGFSVFEVLIVFVFISCVFNVFYIFSARSLLLKLV